MCRRFELTNVFDQEQGFQQANGQGIVEVLFGSSDRAVQLRLESLAQAFKHQVKRGDLPHFELGKLPGDVLKHAQHGAFADRTIFPFKGIGFRQVSNG